MSGPLHTIALDLGGTDLKVARVTRDGALLDFACVPSRAAESAQALLGTLVGAARERLPAAALGIGCPGVIEPASGALVDETPHLALPKDFALAAQLAGELGVAVAADNDANCAAYGEHFAGAARGARVSVTITVGTGIGCGIVVDGRVLRGAWGGAGEISHMGQRSSGPRCKCGVEGCAETTSGGEGLTHRAQAAGLAVGSARDVFDRAAGGDAIARRLIAEMTDALGHQIAAVVQVVNPDVLVIGGGVAQAGDTLRVPVVAALHRYAQHSHTARLRVVPAELGNKAGVVGAGLMAWERVEVR
ncbi:MAG: ROK family protein [Candidatus Eisenbacteria bacterium]|uniref:ROK family protein n=1 Tax=Eiseniibacteriota bacterium TaxID=2212470 RepID=A0A933W916_UNCEI|nr:ROK family protein [Candidatus Eisenbacteria bacterium]